MSKQDAERELRIAKVVSLVSAGVTPAEVAVYAREKAKWPVTAAELSDYLTAARQVIRAAADVDAEYAAGCALTRLDDLYKKAMIIQDHKTALAVQREINRLLGLAERQHDLFFGDK